MKKKSTRKLNVTTEWLSTPYKKVFACYAAHFLWLVSALLCCSVRISSSFLDCRNAKIHQNPIPLNNLKKIITGKSFSKALVLASTNPQYVKRLFIELQVQYLKIYLSEHVVYINCFECQNKKKTVYVHNMFWAVSFYILTW